MSLAVVINLHSNRGESDLPRIRTVFESRGLTIDELYVAKRTHELQKFVRHAAKGGADIVAVGGGDGSMTVAANALAHKKTTLGVLPLGTGNSFAQTLGLGGGLEQAVDAIAGGRVVAVDLGVVNATYFANFATIGFAAEVAEAAPRRLKRLIGVFAYVVGAVKPFITHQPFTADVRWEGGRLRFRTHQIVVASGRIFGHQPLTPDADITSGRLAFFTTLGVSHGELVRTYLAFAFGQHARLPEAHTFTAERIRVGARPNQRISIDGEPWGRTPADFSVARGALRVFVPPEFHADAR